MNDIRKPMIVAPTAEGQLLQIKSYLIQLVDQLNFALRALERGEGNASTTEAELTLKLTAGLFSEIKSLIMKSSDIIDAYYEKMEPKIDDKIEEHNTAEDSHADIRTLIEELEKTLATFEGGEDGFSPTIEVTEIEGGSQITITDANGTKTVDIMDGANGSDGKDGTNGTNGTNGQDGKDGVSPTVAVSKTGTVTTITITDANGTKTANINDGAKGEKGDKGDTGLQGEQGVQGDKGDKGDKGEKGDKGDKGDPGENGTNGKDGTGVTILGSYATEAELNSAHSTGNAGEAYMIDGNLYVWSATTNKWENVGNIKGEAGADGFSPTVAVSKAAGVTTVEITDKNGTKTATINDGYTPVKGVDYFDGTNGTNGSNGSNGVSCTHSWSGTTLTVTSASGSSSANLKGDKGDKGDNGYTPVKGTDYFTAADKMEMVNLVLASLPTWSGGSY